MIEGMILLFVIVVGIGTNGFPGFSPDNMREYGLASGPQPICREYTPAEANGLGHKPKGKAATYSMDGQFVCEHQVFDYGERDSFFDYVTSVAPGKLEKAARSFARLQKVRPDFNAMWSVRVVADEQPLKSYISDIVHTSFPEAMTTGALLAGVASSGAPAVIEVEVHRIQDRDLLISATAVLTSMDGKQSRWSL